MATAEPRDIEVGESGRGERELALSDLRDARDGHRERVRAQATRARPAPGLGLEGLLVGYQELDGYRGGVLGNVFRVSWIELALILSAASPIEMTNTTGTTMFAIDALAGVQLVSFPRADRNVFSWINLSAGVLGSLSVGGHEGREDASIRGYLASASRLSCNLQFRVQFENGPELATDDTSANGFTARFMLLLDPFADEDTDEGGCR